LIISHKYKFIFIKNRKIAGTSIETYLSKYKGDNDVFTPINPPVEGHVSQNYRGLFNPFNEILSNANSSTAALSDFIKGRKFWNHIPSRLVKARVSNDVWESYYKFCVERNPWDKTLSQFYMWKEWKNNINTLDDYFANGIFPKDLQRYTLDGKIAVNKIIKYENLSHELAEIFHELGIPWGGSLGVRAKSGFRKDRRPYTEILNEEQIEIIADEFAEEIRIMNY
jgi:hypothetical protein